MKKQDQELQFEIEDNGVGMPQGLDWRNSNTLGLKLVRTLVKDQLGGSIDMENNHGTKFIVKFKMK